MTSRWPGCSTTPAIDLPARRRLARHGRPGARDDAEGDARPDGLPRRDGRPRRPPGPGRGRPAVRDLPRLGLAQAVRSACRLLKETDCQAVKLEGGRRMAATIRAVVDADVPVVGHVGLTPQSVRHLGGYKVQRDAEALLADAERRRRGRGLRDRPGMHPGRGSRPGSPPSCRSRPSASAPGPAATARCSSPPICSASSRASGPEFVRRYAELGGCRPRGRGPLWRRRPRRGLPGGGRSRSAETRSPADGSAAGRLLTLPGGAVRFGAPGLRRPVRPLARRPRMTALPPSPQGSGDAPLVNHCRESPGSTAREDDAREAIADAPGASSAPGATSSARRAASGRSPPSASR